jgi:hypothetical protein
MKYTFKETPIDPTTLRAINNTLHAEMSRLNDGSDRVDHRVTRRAGGAQ